MERLRLFASTEMVHVATDKIVYVRDDVNYSDFVLTTDKAKRRVLTRFDPFYYITTRHNETLWDFAANTASSMPSRSPVVLIMYSITTKMVPNTTSAILQSILGRNGREQSLGWCIGKYKERTSWYNLRIIGYERLYIWN